MIYDSVVARSWKRTLISGRPLWTWPMKQFKIGTYDASVYKYDECIKSSLHFDPFKSLIHCAFSNNTHWVRALQCTASALSVIMNYFIVVVKKPTFRFFFPVCLLFANPVVTWLTASPWFRSRSTGSPRITLILRNQIYRVKWNSINRGIV